MCNDRSWGYPYLSHILISRKLEYSGNIPHPVLPQNELLSRQILQVSPPPPSFSRMVSPTLLSQPAHPLASHPGGASKQASPVAYVYVMLYNFILPAFLFLLAACLCLCRPAPHLHGLSPSLSFLLENSFWFSFRARTTHQSLALLLQV